MILRKIALLLMRAAHNRFTSAIHVKRNEARNIPKNDLKMCTALEYIYHSFYTLAVATAKECFTVASPCPPVCLSDPDGWISIKFPTEIP